MQEALKKFFNFEEYETNFKKEIIAGTTNFLTMAYSRSKYHNIALSRNGF